jgi:hypothetical protein
VLATADYDGPMKRKLIRQIKAGNGSAFRKFP